MTPGLHFHQAGHGGGTGWARCQPAALSRNAQSSIAGGPREPGQGCATVVTEAASGRSGCSVASPWLPARHGARVPSAAGETLALQGFLTWGLGAARGGDMSGPLKRALPGEGSLTL